LDTRYWIHLRDAAMGRARLNSHGEILAHIRSLVSNGAAICPVSDVTWMELSKQTDCETRLASADLLDELSLGVAIMSERDRIVAEIEHFLAHPHIAKPTPVLKDRVWVKSGYVLGVTVPIARELPTEINTAMQKTSVDLLWRITHREMADKADSLPPIDDRYEENAARITAAMRRYAHEIRSIQQAFAAESAGVLDLFKDEIQTMLLRLFCRSAGSDTTVSIDQAEEATRTMLRGLTNALRLRPKVMAQRLPTVYAYAMCHAAVRMDRTRKFNGHDLLDIHHASSGIPYHDAVFTENPLRVLVTAGNVGLDKAFSCAVLAKENEVLDYLRRLH
ncbi:MAG: hypothetical protein Q8S20_22430, partial [Sulfuritalea sp.]|nr:hypothetical protein [Sulfuritalea sp.]